MRLFAGMDIAEDVQRRIAEYVARMQREASGVRWVQPETWHVTLKFIGETQRAEEIREALKIVRIPRFEVEFRGSGFFTPSQPRVFWAGVHASDIMPRLAKQIDEATAAVGIHREENIFKPHLTLARSGTGSPHERGRGNSGLAALRDRLAKEPQPEFGTMLAKEFFLYQSQLSPQGARYHKLERYELKP